MAISGCAGSQITNVLTDVPEPTIEVPTEYTNVYTDIERADVLKTKAEQEEIIQDMSTARDTRVQATTQQIVNRQY